MFVQGGGVAGRIKLRRMVRLGFRQSTAESGLIREDERAHEGPDIAEGRGRSQAIFLSLFQRRLRRSHIPRNLFSHFVPIGHGMSESGASEMRFRETRSMSIV